MKRNLDFSSDYDRQVFFDIVKVMGPRVRRLFLMFQTESQIMKVQDLILLGQTQAVQSYFHRYLKRFLPLSPSERVSFKEMNYGTSMKTWGFEAQVWFLAGLMPPRTEGHYFVSIPDKEDKVSLRLQKTFASNPCLYDPLTVPAKQFLEVFWRGLPLVESLFSKHDHHFCDDHMVNEYDREYVKSATESRGFKGSMMDAKPLPKKTIVMGGARKYKLQVEGSVPLSDEQLTKIFYRVGTALFPEEIQLTYEEAVSAIYVSFGPVYGSSDSHGHDPEKTIERVIRKYANTLKTEHDRVHTTVSPLLLWKEFRKNPELNPGTWDLIIEKALHQVDRSLMYTYSRWARTLTYKRQFQFFHYCAQFKANWYLSHMDNPSFLLQFVANLTRMSANSPIRVSVGLYPLQIEELLLIAYYKEIPLDVIFYMVDLSIDIDHAYQYAIVRYQGDDCVFRTTPVHRDGQERLKKLKKHFPDTLARATMFTAGEPILMYQPTHNPKMEYVERLYWVNEAVNVCFALKKPQGLLYAKLMEDPGVGDGLYFCNTEISARTWCMTPSYVARQSIPYGLPEDYVVVALTTPKLKLGKKNLWIVFFTESRFIGARPFGGSTLLLAQSKKLDHIEEIPKLLGGSQKPFVSTDIAEAHDNTLIVHGKEYVFKHGVILPSQWCSCSAGLDITELRSARKRDIKLRKKESCIMCDKTVVSLRLDLSLQGQFGRVVDGLPS